MMNTDPITKGVLTEAILRDGLRKLYDIANNSNQLATVQLTPQLSLFYNHVYERISMHIWVPFGKQTSCIEIALDLCQPVSIKNRYDVIASTLDEMSQELSIH